MSPATGGSGDFRDATSRTSLHASRPCSRILSPPLQLNMKDGLGVPTDERLSSLLQCAGKPYDEEVCKAVHMSGTAATGRRWLQEPYKACSPGTERYETSEVNSALHFSPRRTGAWALSPALTHSERTAAPGGQGGVRAGSRHRGTEMALMFLLQP